MTTQIFEHPVPPNDEPWKGFRRFYLNGCKIDVAVTNNSLGPMGFPTASSGTSHLPGCQPTRRKRK